MPSLKLTVPDPLQVVQDALSVAGIDVVETRSLDHGWQLRGGGGEVVNVYKTGAVVPQGKNAVAVTAAVEAARRSSPVTKPTAPKPRTVAPVLRQTPVEPRGSVEAYTPHRPAGWRDDWSDWDGVSPPWNS